MTEIVSVDFHPLQTALLVGLLSSSLARMAPDDLAIHAPQWLVTFLLCVSYAGILFNALATITALCLIDGLGHNESTAAHKDEVARSTLHLLCQLRGQRTLKFVFLQCE